MLIRPAMGMYTLPATGRWSTRQRPLFQNEHPSILLSFYMNFAHKYVIFMKGDTLDDVVEEGLHQVYVFLMRALQEHRRQGRNGDYESFAIELLALLQKYRPLYTTPMLEPPEADIRS